MWRLQAKEMKRRILNELTIAICTEAAALTNEVSGAICQMVAANAFRDIPAPASPNAPEFDPEEDDPMLVPEWDHLRVRGVYLPETGSFGCCLVALAGDITLHRQRDS